jgi:hypothetical protein
MKSAKPLWKKAGKREGWKVIPKAKPKLTDWSSGLRLSLNGHRINGEKF